MMIVAGIAAGRDLSRLEDRVLVVILAIAWVGAAARRLADFRQGHCRAVTLDSRSPVSTLCLLAFGTAPWFAVGPLQYAYPDAAIWTRLNVPPVLTVVGIVMAVTTLEDRSSAGA